MTPIRYTVTLPTCIMCNEPVEWRQQVCAECGKPDPDFTYAGVETTTVFIPQGDE